jgi:hypothetical protein
MADASTSARDKNASPRGSSRRTRPRRPVSFHNLLSSDRPGVGYERPDDERKRHGDEADEARHEESPPEAQRRLGQETGDHRSDTDTDLLGAREVAEVGRPPLVGYHSAHDHRRGRVDGPESVSGDGSRGLR